MLLKKLFASIAKLFDSGPVKQPEPATPGQGGQTSVSLRNKKTEFTTSGQAKTKPEKAKVPAGRRLSIGKRSFLWDGELLRAQIKHISDYPIPSHDDGSLVEWISVYGVPYDRQNTIRLLAAFGRRLPSSEEVAVIQRSGSGLKNNGRVLLWVRNARDRLYALPDGSLQVPDSSSPGQVALLSVWD